VSWARWHSHTALHNIDVFVINGGGNFGTVLIFIVVSPKPLKTDPNKPLSKFNLKWKTTFVHNSCMVPALF